MQAKTQALWDKLRRPHCTRCVLHETAQTVCLLGDGPTPARWMAIGEAPGEREDEIAFKPFAGAAGKFLDQTLEDNGLSRSDFYITNAVKCRPPNNRTPKREEALACNVYLRAELRIHKPEYVLLLGDAALKATTGVKGLMANRQRIIEKDGYKFFVALHPAAGLHRPAYRQLFKDDIAAFARLVSGKISKRSTTYTLINTKQSFADFLLKLKAEPAVAFDVETEGAIHASQRNKAGSITIFGCSFGPGHAFVVPLDHAEGWAPKSWEKHAALIAENLFIKGKKLIAHNGKYDVRWFLKYKPDAEFTFDTMLAAFLLDENRSVALENLALGELKVSPWKSDVQYRRDFPLRKYAKYNAYDCDYTFRLYELYRPQLLQLSRLGKVFKAILMPSANLFARIEDRGIYIPEDRLQERTTRAHELEQEQLQALMSFVPKGMKPQSNAELKAAKKGPWFNPGSSDQMARLLYSEEGLGLDFPAEAKLTKLGKQSTAENALKLLNHPISPVIEKWRYYKSKVLATYFLRWKALRDARGFAHFTYNLIGAVTGRTSSDLHQVPRDPFVRGVLSVEDDEWMWGSADFSQAEMRVAAHLSKDPVLRRIFITAEVDVHTNTAMKITGLLKEQVDSESRKKAKAVNFGFLYRMFEKKFRDYAREKFEVHLTMAEARAYRRDYFDEYAGLEPWHKRQIEFCKMHGYMSYLDGRVRRLPEIWSENPMDVAEAERQAINSPVQGVVSDMALLAMVIGEYGYRHHQPLVDENFQWQGQMHDEVIFKVRRGYQDEKCQALKVLMEDLPLKELFGFEFSVPIIAEVKLGKFWGEAKEWKPTALATAR